MANIINRKSQTISENCSEGGRNGFLRGITAEIEPGLESPIAKCQLIELPKIQDQRGNLTFIEAGRHVPFDFKRAYFLYDVPGGSTRGGHAHKALHQLIIAISGSFDITLTDGKNSRRFHLNRSYFGLCVPPMIWRDMDNFSSGSVALVLASDYFDETDYYREYNDYLKAQKIYDEYTFS
jgi:dTDP-4-dehydrorhamnose 3,5-epimerase-like enzyme